MFNNAGVQLLSGIDELRVDDWQRQIDLNVSGVMNTVAAFLPALTAAAEAGRPADLINSSSIVHGGPAPAREPHGDHPVPDGAGRVSGRGHRPSGSGS
ncbi:SDR family NAD(P)-dependent oxidoreductase [Pseudonocardia cypriaca]|uniref:SDR family NAD(P)-dependent oxidoreductase n=1 Tax=Pseudonocardia cypriaca TaxID=882449 RepID=UPI001B86AA5D|nr:SDR family NAD(P)-dependent oxidoreductase [Pseudonocardia cypriaca]